MKILIDQSIKRIMPYCRLGCIVVNCITVRGTPPTLAQEFSQLQTEVAKIYNPDLLKKIPRIMAVRSMYRKLDFDPSRYRPASEALVRRVLQNRGLHFVNSAVDVNNYCSIKFLMPFGLYDIDKINGDIKYQLASDGSYVNIAGKEITAGGKPFLTDIEGVFGNPTSDARRTAVTLNTKNILSVIYVDEEVSDDSLYEVMDFTAQMLVRHNGGEVLSKMIVQG